MVTTVFLIRHGETEGGEIRRYKGHIDVPLSEKGVKQIRRLAEYIVQNSPNSLNSLNGLSELYGLNAVYTSDLSRAVNSAEIIALPFRLKLGIIPAIKERNFGLWEGMSFDEIKSKYPDEFRAWAENPLKFCPLGGESTLDVRDRAMPAINEIIENHKGERIAIVSHGGVNRIILCHFLGMPLENIFRIEQDYGALNIIELWDEYPIIKLINYIV